MTEPAIFTGSEPFVQFLAAYPFPAFVLKARAEVPLAGDQRTRLQPVYGNTPYLRLILGQEYCEKTSGLESVAMKGLEEALGHADVNEARKLVAWIQRLPTENDGTTGSGHTVALSLRPSWLPVQDEPVVLVVTKTLVGSFWVCTSIPQAQLPVVPPSTTRPQSPSVATESRRKSPKLRLPYFPPPPTFHHIRQQSGIDVKHKTVGSGIVDSSSLSAFITPYGSSSTVAPVQSKRAPLYGPVNSLVVFPKELVGEMERMVESFPWETTDLGPKEGWSQALRTTLSICLRSPINCALLWGPSMIMMYNDTYAAMTRSKHPRIFAKPACEAWCEVWDKFSKMAERVHAGESVAKSDDIMFFERMTPSDPLEEVYHTWSWVPVKGENGRVEGILNWSIETTQKVIAERRLMTLRTMGERAKLCKNVGQLTEALLSVLDQQKEDAPFAAFYHCQASNGTGPHAKEGPDGASASSYDQQPIRAILKLAGSIGVPTPHPATPTTRELYLSPATLRRRPASQRAVGSVANPDSMSPTNTPSQSNDTSEKSSASSRSSISSSKSHHFAGIFQSASQSTSSTSTTPWTWPFADALMSRRAVLVRTLPVEVAETLSRRAWDDIPRQAVLVPIWAYEGDNSTTALPQALLVLGINPRRPYDRDYEEWVDLFRISLGVSLAAVLSWEAEVQRAEQLAQLDAAKTSFFSNVSHELRTPLTLVLGPIQDAMSSSKDAKVKESLKLALRNVSRLSRLVDSLMDFTRIESGRLLGTFKPVQLGAFTADLASVFRGTIEGSRIEYKVECDTTTSVTSYVDYDLWEKIVYNLIGNAFKYTMHGSISVRVYYQTNEVVCIIEDTGVGIPKEDVDKVFERFYRVSSVSRSHEGTGIGLSLTKELVRLHGATITVVSRTSSESADGSHGSAFTVTMPLGKDHLPPAHIDDSTSETPRTQHYAKGVLEEATQWSRQCDVMKTPSDTSDSGGSDGSKLDSSTLFFVKKDLLLLVDDSHDMRQFITSIFVGYCTVVAAVHGQQALDLIDRGLRPTVVVCDVMMPMMDGFGLMKALRERPDTKLIPVIFLTARAGEEARVDGLLSGADDYIAKPFQGRELVARVHLQMQLGKRRAEERQREIQILSDHSPIGIVRTDSGGRIIYVNPRWFELTGQTGQEFDDWEDSIHPDHVDDVSRLWRQVFEEHCGGSLEFQWKNGVWTKGQIVPLGKERNAWAGILFTITDISDQRLYEASKLLHAQEREATARKRAEEAEDRRRDADERRRGQELLIDVTSHELRQPVSAILNCSALVRENLGKLRDELFECYMTGSSFLPQEELLNAMDEDLDALDSIYQCGLAQERIANDVLSLSRIQLQVLSIYPVEFELIPEVRRIVAIFTNELKMKGIKVALNFGESIQRLRIRRIRSDKSRIGQVLTNLLSNAIKFADTSVDKREIQVDVNVSFTPPKEGTCTPPLEDKIPDDPDAPLYLYVAVKDSGPGLKADDLTLLFKRFQQGSNSHDVFGGSGLGLFVSRKLCDLMNGRIDVDSVFGQGATFRFFIQASNSPMKLDSREEPWSISEIHSEVHGRASGRDVNPGTSGQKSPPYILITEDNLINQTVLNRQLKGAGFATTLASHGQQAIERIREFAAASRAQNHSKLLFDAILMDCEMPVMDGLTAVREIRRLEASGEIPGRNRVFALTGNARSGQVQSARDAGMDDVLIKPYKLRELLFKLREHHPD